MHPSWGLGGFFFPPLDCTSFYFLFSLFCQMQWTMDVETQTISLLLRVVANKRGIECGCFFPLGIFDRLGIWLYFLVKETTCLGVRRVWSSWWRDISLLSVDSFVDWLWSWLLESTVLNPSWLAVLSSLFVLTVFFNYLPFLSVLSRVSSFYSFDRTLVFDKRISFSSLINWFVFTRYFFVSRRFIIYS